MKVVFLDVDGVMNSHQSAERGLVRDGQLLIDPKAAKRLNRVVHEVPGVKFVLSSTWRFSPDKCGENFDLFVEAGFDGEFVGRTPSLVTRTDGGIFVQQERGMEILAWLNEHHDVERFVIVDDDRDMGFLIDHLVKTKSETGGLLDEHVDEIIRRLNGE